MCCTVVCVCLFYIAWLASDWEKVLFTDETIDEIDSSYYQRWVQRPKGTHTHTTLTHKHNTYKHSTHILTASHILIILFR